MNTLNNKTNNCWRTLNEIIKLAEENPNQKIWCISNYKKADFVMTAAEIKQAIGNFDWDGINFAIVTEKENTSTIPNYVPKAKPKVIKFSSRASIKIKDSFYTFEYGEERQIDNFDEVDIEREKQALIDDCNTVVDNQIEEVINLARNN